MNRRQFLVRGFLGSVGAAAATVGYTLRIEPHWLQFVRRDLRIARLPAALHGATLAQVSDLHVGPKVSDDYLIRSLERLRSLVPDIVVCTGDFLTHRVERGDEQFAQLRSEALTIDGLDIIGVDDLWAGRADTSAALAARRSDAAIALCHNPDGLDRLSWADYSGWVLAGHTHGGQCKPPFLKPPLLPVANRRYVSGEVRVDSARTLYISRGLGHLLRARFNVRPEITLFTLQPA